MFGVRRILHNFAIFGSRFGWGGVSLAPRTCIISCDHLFKPFLGVLPILSVKVVCESHRSSARFFRYVFLGIAALEAVYTVRSEDFVANPRRGAVFYKHVASQFTFRRGGGAHDSPRLGKEDTCNDPMPSCSGF